MRIALVVPGGVDRSGEYRVVPALLGLVERLAAQHDLTVFALTQEPQPGEWRLAGAKVINIGTHRTRWRAIREILRQSRPVPFDLIHSIWSWLPGLVAVSAARLLGIPSVVHVAGGELAALRDIAYGGRLTWRGRLREMTVLRGATVVTAASTLILESLSQLGVGARRMPLGVDLKIWPPRPPERRPPGAPARLIHIANLNRVKDQPTLLWALRSLRAMKCEFLLDVVGEDTLQGEIQSLAQRLGLAPCVTFHGFMTQRALRPVLERADLLVLSSRHEAGPVVMLEAAVVGVPTVGTAVGHVAEWSPNAALAVPVGDSASLARAIASALSDEELRMRLARRAFDRARREDADHTAREFDAIYRGCVSL
ncbi:MAG TPA: glycosyltransferase family 4 protein [Steroidobacteraceae bacterium]|nr:glycosyltransferase family 4 protein [Steroidobacteraceae bacterium]